MRHLNIYMLEVLVYCVNVRHFQWKTEVSGITALIPRASEKVSECK